MSVYRKDHELDQWRALRSAKAVVPVLIDMFQPQSVVDVGCGVGAWLSVFRESGVARTLGVDGDYMKDMLHIPQDCFMGADLTKPVIVQNEFDLVVSLEVAEHLPAQAADTFVGSLTKLGPVVLFSAAIPFQDGTNHVNTQWPDYWAQLFKARGFLAIDQLRSRFWNNADVDWWYTQNMILYMRQDTIDRLNARRLDQFVTCTPVALVHPLLYLRHARELDRIRSQFVYAACSLLKKVVTRGPRRILEYLVKKTTG
jgi:SAM-dependent methyltransferase